MALSKTGYYDGIINEMKERQDARIAKSEENIKDFERDQKEKVILMQIVLETMAGLKEELKVSRDEVSQMEATISRLGAKIETTSKLYKLIVGLSVLAVAGIGAVGVHALRTGRFR